jgi:mono/diheme cytochrome c family protein
MRTIQIKVIAIVFFAFPLILLTIFKSTPLKVAAATDDDAATMYTKFLCVVCHTKTATKNFDPSKPDAELVQIILKGKKAEKPPNMPAFEAKSMTEAQAQSLVTYMKGLRAPTN